MEPYDQSRYEYDRAGKQHAARLKEHAILFRLTSIGFTGPRDVLTGRGPVTNDILGRYNEPDQATTYCSNNILICIGEVLFHLYGEVLDAIREGRGYSFVTAPAYKKKCLVVAAVEEIDQLVYVDCRAVVRDFGQRMSGTAVVFPERCYEPLSDFNRKVRMQHMKGVVYPSARHSADVCVALFDDRTTALKDDGLELVPIELRLIPENQEPGEPPRQCDPCAEKLHPTMGHYRFTDANKLEELRSRGLLHPCDIPVEGMTDFVRRRYVTYPRDAVLV